MMVIDFDSFIIVAILWDPPIASFFQIINHYPPPLINKETKKKKDECERNEHFFIPFFFIMKHHPRRYFMNHQCVFSHLSLSAKPSCYLNPLRDNKRKLTF
jgi:hypothetical protein